MNGIYLENYRNLGVHRSKLANGPTRLFLTPRTSLKNRGSIVMAVNTWCMGMISQLTRTEEIAMKVSRRRVDSLYVNEQKELVRQV